MNIRPNFFNKKIKILLISLLKSCWINTLIIGLSLNLYAAEDIRSESVQACVITREAPLSMSLRNDIAHCLGWQMQTSYSLCGGNYQPIVIEPLSDEQEVKVTANRFSFYNEGRSTLDGNVEIQQTGRAVTAHTAYIYRDAKSKQVSKIELLGEVNYREPGRVMIARKATINPHDKSGKVEEVLYRFNSERPGAILPAWGRASFVERFANKDYLLQQATYSTCAPQDNAWHIEAEKISLDDANKVGVARHAKLYVGKVPLIYTPYFSFPTSKERKSGFLMPVVGSTNVGGLDLALPYYINIAPNYDATITPHLYSNRGLMMGGELRYLTDRSYGRLNAHFLSDDRAYKQFLKDNELFYPQLRDNSAERWSLQLYDLINITPDLRFRVNFQQVSDDYFLQDFNSNFAILTERQLVREAELTYNTLHWSLRTMVQGYQTLQPINEPELQEIYRRLPQVLALGSYDDLMFNSNLFIQGQFDNFSLSAASPYRPEGLRYHLNPVFSIPQTASWGFINPAVEAVESFYDLSYYYDQNNKQLQRFIPRFHIDSGLIFERDLNLMQQNLTQTLEPHLFYLNVPYTNQTAIPVFDAGYMIFNVDQLFRTNRFSGLDRIGDAHQLSYGLSSSLISDTNGIEKAKFTMGQIYYFTERKVKLCQNVTGDCTDNPLVLGYLSPKTTWSPIASRFNYHFNRFWSTSLDYVWDVNTRSTNNSQLNFHYQPDVNKLINFGYSYMVMGDITQLPTTTSDQIAPLHQFTLSYAWPFTAKWSTLGSYSYNLSKNYEMMYFLGVQYDSCCWALRLLGGKSFKSLSPEAHPQYNNNIYLQLQLKGLASVGSNAPSSIIRTFLPGYVDSFHN